MGIRNEKEWKGKTGKNRVSRLISGMCAGAIIDTCVMCIVKCEYAHIKRAMNDVMQTTPQVIFN